jgi:hypothetical protein
MAKVVAAATWINSKGALPTSFRSNPFLSFTIFDISVWNYEPLKTPQI